MDDVPLLNLSALAILFAPSPNLGWIWCLVHKLRLGISLMEYHAPFRANRYRRKISTIQLPLFLCNSQLRLDVKVAATPRTWQKKIGKIAQIQMRQSAW